MQRNKIGKDETTQHKNQVSGDSQLYIFFSQGIFEVVVGWHVEVAIALYLLVRNISVQKYFLFPKHSSSDSGSGNEGRLPSFFCSVLFSETKLSKGQHFTFLYFLFFSAQVICFPQLNSQKYYVSRIPKQNC